MYFKIFYTFMLIFVISNLAVDLYNFYNTGVWEPFGNIIEGATGSRCVGSKDKNEPYYDTIIKPGYKSGAAHENYDRNGNLRKLQKGITQAECIAIAKKNKPHAKYLVISIPLKKSNSGRSPTIAVMATATTINRILLQISQVGFSSILTVYRNSFSLGIL